MDRTTKTPLSPKQLADKHLVKAWKADKTVGKSVLNPNGPRVTTADEMYNPSYGAALLTQQVPGSAPVDGRAALAKVQENNRPSSWRPVNAPAAADSTGKATVNDSVVRSERNPDYQAYRKAEDRMTSHGSSTGSNILRKLIPLPSNASGYVMKKVTHSNQMDDSSLSDAQKGIMYKVIQNAVKRTGKLSGGTEYSDYQGAVSPEEYKDIEDVRAGKINPVKGTLLGAGSKGYDLATTLGRVSYAVNPYTNEAILTDGYDFTNNYTQDKKGKLRKDYMKGKTDQYSLIRKSLAEEDQDQSQQDKDRNFVGMRLKPSDTTAINQVRF